MIKLFATIFIVSSLAYGEMTTMYNQLKYTNLDIVGKSSKDDIAKEHSNLNKLSFNGVGRYSYEDFAIEYDIEFYTMDEVPTKMRSISLDYTKKSDMQINSLYARYYLMDDVSVYLGTIPFKGGRFSEYKDPTMNGGNGLPVLINQVFMSGFMTYRCDDWTFIAGKASWQKENNFRSLQDKNDNSDGEFYIAKYESGKHYLEFDHYNVNVLMDSFKYSELTLSGVGYSYDDSADSGMTYYVNYGMSKSKEDIVGIMGEYGYTHPMQIAYLKSIGFVTENQNNTGYAYLYGIKYDGSLKDYDYFIGAELFGTNGEYVSMNHGVLFQSDHSWWQNRDSKEYLLYGGIQLNGSTSLLAQYSWGETDKVANAFSISSLNSNNNGSLGYSSYEKFNKFQIAINHRF